MRKNKENNCPYELFCLVNKSNEQKYIEFIDYVKAFFSNDIEIRERTDLKLAQPVKGLENSGYVQINFSCQPHQPGQLLLLLNKKFGDVLNRSNLLNLETEKKQAKLKLV